MNKFEYRAISLAILITIASFFCCGLTLTPKEYNCRTVIHCVSPGETGYEIAYQYMDQQTKYDDVREFWYYICKDSNVDKRIPLPAGKELIINLYNEKEEKR